MLDAYNTNNFTENVPFNLSGGIPADRHPDNNSLGGGDAFGTNGANAGADGETSLADATALAIALG